uniref:RPA-interacting protein C-terminal domain-containing protein n=1 Tax=Lutzomyia longipalpis TaxID=7200 RepID=A0A7G3ALX6_LUTLO
MNSIMTSPTQRIARRIMLCESPVLRDMLRQKCRIRMKEARAHAFNRHRNLMESDQVMMTKIFKSEISELDRDIEAHEEVIQELMNEADQWLFEEVEKADEDLISHYESGSVQVFCPICQKNLLQQQGSTISCPCGMRFIFENGLERFHEIIQMKVVYHETFCDKVLQFFKEPKFEEGFYSLSAICNYCEYMTSIIL